MTTAAEPAPAPTFSNRQRTFVRYFTAILIDLVVLNLFVEYTDWVTLAPLTTSGLTIGIFTLSLLAALLLQVLLKLTIAVEHRIAAMLAGRSKALRIFCAWLVLFGSKFVILEALDIAFGDALSFAGPWHGLLTLILVLVVMLVVEELVVRIYRRLA